MLNWPLLLFWLTAAHYLGLKLLLGITATSCSSCCGESSVITFFIFTVTRFICCIAFHPQQWITYIILYNNVFISVLLVVLRTVDPNFAVSQWFNSYLICITSTLFVLLILRLDGTLETLMSPVEIMDASQCTSVQKACCLFLEHVLQHHEYLQLLKHSHHILSAFHSQISSSLWTLFFDTLQQYYWGICKHCTSVPLLDSYHKHDLFHSDDN